MQIYQRSTIHTIFLFCLCKLYLLYIQLNGCVQKFEIEIVFLDNMILRGLVFVQTRFINSTNDLLSFHENCDKNYNRIFMTHY